MKAFGALLFLPILCIALQGFPSTVTGEKRFSKQWQLGLPQPVEKPIKTARPIPDDVIKIYNDSRMRGESLNLRCIFPKITRTKRAIKIIFKKNILKDEGGKWKRDELRIFMNKSKGPITSSRKPYYVKIFDLNSRRLVTTYEFSSKDFGWKTINLSGWRYMEPRNDSKGRIGLKIVALLGKKKMYINKTAFRKSGQRFEPYFIEFFHTKNERSLVSTTKPRGLSISDLYKKMNSVPPAAKNDVAKRDYLIPFQRYDMKRGRQ